MHFCLLLTFFNVPDPISLELLFQVGFKLYLASFFDWLKSRSFKATFAASLNWFRLLTLLFSNCVSWFENGRKLAQEPSCVTLPEISNVLD